MKFRNPKINDINQEPFFRIHSKKDVRTFNIRKFTYGVLSTDLNNPLCCASISNSTISIDYWKGCPWQCAYCHVQGSSQDWEEGKSCMGRTPTPRSQFSVEDIMDAVIKHPFFKKDETIISIGTASTEPFSQYAIDSTFDIMEYLVSQKLKNPIWIVTKSHFPQNYQDRLQSITRNGNKVLISICWANNPAEIEPMRNNRFKNIELIKNANAHTSWYLRPLAKTWSTDEKHLRETFEYASKYKDFIDMVVPGGLRWTEGIEYAMEEIKGIKLPPIPKNDNTKFLPEKTKNLILELHKDFFGEDKPLFFKSSCSLSYLLGIPCINLAELRNPEECDSSLCPAEQRAICAKYKLPSKTELQSRIDKLGLEEITIKKIYKKWRFNNRAFSRYSHICN